MHNRIYYLIISLALFLLAGVNSFAAFPTRGTWAYQTVASGTTVNVTLTDDVSLTGPIVIEKNAVLNITRAETQYDGGTDLIRITLASNFTVPSGCKNCMFWVKEGGTLNIDGINQGYAIGLKASYKGSLPKPYENGTWKTKTEYEAELNTALAYTVAADNKKIHNYTGGGAIYAVGNVSLKAARIYDAYSSYEGAAIYRPMNDASLNYTYGTIELNNTRISECVANCGPALLIYNQRSDKNGYGAANNDSSCKVTLSNLTRIFNCVSRGGSACGAIRTGGGVVGDMELTRTEIYNNMAYGDGAGIYWNAHGDDEVDTRLTMKQCRVYENKALRNGGGLVLEATFEFLKGTASHDRFPNLSTDISDNIAEKNGGGIWCTTYNAVSGVGVQTLDFGLNENVQVLNNSAVCGGGVAYEMRDTTSLTNNSTLNMMIDGAVIKNNTATAVGGGIYFRSNSSKLNTNLIIDGGTIQGNNATKYGGGIYAIKGPQLDVSKSMVKLNSGTISDNNATSGSGGGVSVYGLKVQCDTDASGIMVKNNKASLYYGGGIHLEEGASFTMNSGTVTGNSSEKQGGGVFVRDSEMIQNGGVISSNKSNLSGGGIYLRGQNAPASYRVTSGTVSGNTAEVSGGGMFVADNSTASVSGGAFYGNKATTADGGGIFCIGNLKIDGNCQIGMDGSPNEAVVGYGGGICLPIVVDGATYVGSCTMSGGSVSYNKSGNHGGGIYSQGAIEITDGIISHNHSDDYGGGIYFESSSEQVTIEGGTISYNDARYGAGVFVNNGICAMTGGSVDNNISTTGGGGIFVSSTLYVKGNTSITNNKANGASDNINAGGGGVLVSTGGKFHMSESSVISGNTSVASGGGLRARSGASEIVVDNGEISSNESSVSGGGLALFGGSLTLNGGSISNNTASYYGGGVYVEVLASAHCLIDGVAVNSNTANRHGGGVYIYSGTLDISGGEVSGNKAMRINNQYGFGGGVYVYSGAHLNFSGGVISHNSAFSGAGIFLTGSSLDFTEGTMSANTATNAGGGIYLYGASSASMSGGNVVGNSARMGGGIYLMGTSKMTFGNGIIRNNHAVYNSGSETTGYNNTTRQGVGGGVCVDGNGSFEFKEATRVGLYSNMADKAGDDILLNGQGGSVTLPDVSSMDLSGYNSMTSELYWVEDYMTGDTGYANGTAIGGAGHSAVRYRDAIAAQSTVYKVPSGTYTGKYLALSIGYEVIYVTLQRTGLQAGESAIYRIFRIDDGVPSVYSEVLLTGSAGAPVQSKRVALYSGEWKVQEIPWTWTYAAPAVIERTITGSTDAQDKVFSFTAAKKESVPEHAEDVVVNDFGEGVAVTGSYINSSSINDLQETTDYQLK